jgi:hypothetical protein
MLALFQEDLHASIAHDNRRHHINVSCKGKVSQFVCYRYTNKALDHASLLIDKALVM